MATEPLWAIFLLLLEAMRDVLTRAVAKSHIIAEENENGGGGFEEWKGMEWKEEGMETEGNGRNGWNGNGWKPNGMD